MKKIVIGLAMLSMLLVAALPVWAQDVSGSGDNGNQCVGEQNVVNTGDAQTAIEIEQADPAEVDDSIDFDFIEDVEDLFGEDVAEDVLLDLVEDFGEDNDGDGVGDEFDFEDVGSTITVSPSNSTNCDQTVDQDATALSY